MGGELWRVPIMAALARTRSAGLCRILWGSRPLSTSQIVQNASGSEVDTTGKGPGSAVEPVTHTGQVWQNDDYRRSRFVGKSKLVNPNWAIEMVAEEPVVVCTKRVVSSCSGGALGHPKVFINLDPPKVHICGYSGRKFVLKNYYDEETIGPSITFEQYLEEIGREEQ